MALTTISSDRLATNVKNTNFTSAEKQDLTDDIKPLLGSSGGGVKNLVINGAMQVAQRGTSSTTSGYGSVDRFQVNYSGTDEAPTQAQVDVASGTSPYTSGFRKALKITNGNQTSGAGADDYIRIIHFLEAQNVAQSGWNYVSSSSNITLSFWVKSSVAQNFYGFLLTNDGTAYSYPFETGSLTADTWTKITKTIPGNSNLTVNNDNGTGLEFQITPFYGTNKTGSVSLNAWGAFSSSARTPDYTSTWYTTNDATFEITGVQLEVGSVATDFEHRSFAQELELCKRYYEQFDSNGLLEASFGVGYFESNNNLRAVVPLHEKRADVSFSSTAASTFASMNTANMPAGSSISLYKTGKKAAIISLVLSSDVTSGDGRAGILCAQSSTEATLKFDSEL